MIIRITAEQLRNPFESTRTLIREEDAAHCDGSVCGQVFSDEDGDAVLPGPHHHVVVTGEEPSAAPRYFAVGLSSS